MIYKRKNHLQWHFFFDHQTVKKTKKKRKNNNNIAPLAAEKLQVYSRIRRDCETEKKISTVNIFGLNWPLNFKKIRKKYDKIAPLLM